MSKINENIKAYFIDLDGTTLDDKNNQSHTPSITNIKAINKARKKGIKVIISTGRMGNNLKELSKVIGGEYTIQANGALITDNKNNIVFESKLSVIQTQLLLSIIRKKKLAVKIDDQYKAYGVSTFITRKVCQRVGWQYESGYNHEMHKDYYKFVFFGLISKSKINKVIDEIKLKVPDVHVVSSTGGRSIEVTSINASKGLADAFVANKFDLKKYETAHIGDTMNDSTASGHVGQLIAMSNSTKSLKKLTPFIGPHYKKGGLAKILNGQYTEKK